MRFLLILTTLILFTACGQTVSPAESGETPIEAQTGNLNQMISFNADGYAALRGRIFVDSQCLDEDGFPATVFIELEVPVRVQGIETYIAVHFGLRYGGAVQKVAGMK